MDDYIYVNFPNGKQQLGVSKDIELEGLWSVRKSQCFYSSVGCVEPSEYIDPPRNLFNPDGVWRLDLVNDMRQSLGGEYYRRRRLIGTLIILDFLCSIALIICKYTTDSILGSPSNERGQYQHMIISFLVMIP